MLLYSHDTYGLGHLRRNLAIARHILERPNTYRVRMLTGSPVARGWPMPEGLEVRQLPPVIKTAAEEYEPRDPSLTLAEVKPQREAVILDSLKTFRPHVFLVDHAPTGMKGELLPALAHIRNHMARTRVVLGLRDILDAPDVVRDLWKREGIHRLLATHYDEIFVYGSRDLFDAVREYGLDPSIAAKAHYCGYIVRDPLITEDNSTVARARKTIDRPKVLVTVGGGGDGFSLLDAYLRALRRLPHRTVHTLMVAGPLMNIEQRRSLESDAAASGDVRIVAHTTELTKLIRRADLVVSMCGYNTTAEILAAKKPSILVPRAGPRAEQRLRATLMGKLGLAWVIHPEENLVRRLAELILAMVAGDRPDIAAQSRVDLGGVHRVGNALDEMLGYGSFSREASA